MVFGVFRIYLRFVWRQSGFAFFGALTSVGALFYAKKRLRFLSHKTKETRTVFRVSFIVLSSWLRYRRSPRYAHDDIKQWSTMCPNQCRIHAHTGGKVARLGCGASPPSLRGEQTPDAAILQENFAITIWFLLRFFSRERKRRLHACRGGEYRRGRKFRIRFPSKRRSKPFRSPDKIARPFLRCIR